MRRRNQIILGWLSAGLDALLIFLSYILAVKIRFQLLDGYMSISMNSLRFHALILTYALTVVLLYSGFHLYQPDRLQNLGRDTLVVFGVNTVSLLGLISLLFVLRIIDFSRATLALFWAISGILVVLKMFLIRQARQKLIRQDRFLRHVVVVGNGQNARNYISETRRRPELGLKVVGYVSRAERPELGKNLGSYEDIEKILEECDFDELIVALDAHEISFMPKILRAADKEGIRVEMIPMYNEYYPAHPIFENVGDTKLVDLRATPLDNIVLASLKRGADIVFSLILLIVLSPLLGMLAVGVKMSSPGPVLFRQERIGKNKKPFVMLKFRSMRTDIDHNGWSKDEDPRKTKFGSLIRKASLDELPQLWNVLTGSMSLVGPRPELPMYVRQFKEEIPLYLIRQQVRPGMTGWAQIHGLRGDTPIDKRVEYDLWYIQNWSLDLDLKILIRTALGGMINSEKIR